MNKVKTYFKFKLNEFKQMNMYKKTIKNYSEKNKVQKNKNKSTKFYISKLYLKKTIHKIQKAINFVSILTTKIYH
jgi:hypothetical protein